MRHLNIQVGYLVRTSCLMDRCCDVQRVESVLSAYVRRQGDDFNGFESVQSANATLSILFPDMQKEARKTLSRAMWKPIIREGREKN